MMPTQTATPTKLAGWPWRLRARYLRVIAYFARVILSVLWWDILLRRLGLKSLSRRTAMERYRQAAVRFRRLATSMGGVWIKVGQFMSARLDVLPEAITSELSGLQDEVAPESYDAIRAVLRRAFPDDLASRFATFEREPLASASLGQVHRATLPGGDRVVVKVKRPLIHALIEVDLTALTRVIGWMKHYPPVTRRADLDALLHEFSRTLWEEVDYLAEAENARRFGELFADDPSIRIPAVYTDLTTEDVLTLEDVYFIKITDYAAIVSAGVDRVEVAARLFQTYLRQIFVDGFFHADPHPGNLFVEPNTGGGWRLVFVDFGMVGHVTPEIKQGLRDLAIAVGVRDADRLMRAYQSLGVILPGADLTRIREAEAAMFDRVWGKSMRELVRTHPQEMRAFAAEFKDVLYEMPFQIPTRLVFLGRCVAILSGMCTGLDPEFNVFEGLAPFARGLIAEEGGAWLEETLELLIEQGRALLHLPAHMDQALTKIVEGKVTVAVKPTPELDRSLRALIRAAHRVVAAVIFAALIISGGMLYVSGAQALGVAGWAAAGLVLLWIVFARDRG